MPLTAPRWVRWGRNNYFRSCNMTHKCLMSNERATAINVLALVISFFCFIRHLKAAPGMCCASAVGTIHHYCGSAISAIFTIMISDSSILCSNYSISRSSIFTSSSSEVVNPLSGLTECVSVVIVHSASSMGCLNPVTFTGISV